MKKKLMLMWAAVAVIAIAMPVAVSQAAIVIYEPFDYTPGVIDGSQAGGTGLSATGWTTSGATEFQSVITPGLDFPGLLTQGNALRRNDRTGQSEANRAISAASQTALTADNSTIWFSLLIDTEESFAKANNLTFLFGTDTVDNPKEDTPTISGGEGLGISFLKNKSGATLTAITVDDGISSRSDGSIGPFPNSLDDPHRYLLFIAGKIDWAANGSDDTLTLYNITDTAAALPAPFATMTADLDQSQFDTLVVSDKNRAIVDEIRFGDTLADVTPVPEPTTIALLGLGGLGIFRRRRA